jgi:hypothetical protein
MRYICANIDEIRDITFKGIYEELQSSQSTHMQHKQSNLAKAVKPIEMLTNKSLI